MFIQLNCECNGTPYTKGQEVDKSDSNFSQLLADKLIRKHHPDAKVFTGDDSNLEKKVASLEALVKELTAERDELADALEKEIEKVHALTGEDSAPKTAKPATAPKTAKPAK